MNFPQKNGKFYNPFFLFFFIIILFLHIYNFATKFPGVDEKFSHLIYSLSNYSPNSLFITQNN